MPFESFFKGWLGEQGTNVMQRLVLNPKVYHAFYDVLVEGESKQTQIDHIIVSKFGIFVIETKNRAGWIYGREGDDYWTVVLHGRKIKFQNPLRQNELHVNNFAHFFEIEPAKIFSVIVFWGDYEIKTQMPENVVTWLQYPFYIKNKKEVLLTESEIERICLKLKNNGTHIPIITNLLNANVIKSQNEREQISRLKKPEKVIGYCIRCRTELPSDPAKPFCPRCYDKWSEWSNPDYKEKYCHRCGKSVNTSKKKPLCPDCYGTSNRLLY
jgi:restriction system protein